MITDHILMYVRRKFWRMIKREWNFLLDISLKIITCSVCVPNVKDLADVAAKWGPVIR